MYCKDEMSLQKQKRKEEIKNGMQKSFQNKEKVFWV